MLDYFENMNGAEIREITQERKSLLDFMAFGIWLLLATEKKFTFLEYFIYSIKTGTFKICGLDTTFNNLEEKVELFLYKNVIILNKLLNKVGSSLLLSLMLSLAMITHLNLLNYIILLHVIYRHPYYEIAGSLNLSERKVFGLFTRSLSGLRAGPFVSLDIH